MTMTRMEVWELESESHVGFSPTLFLLTFLPCRRRNFESFTKTRLSLILHRGHPSRAHCRLYVTILRVKPEHSTAAKVDMCRSQTKSSLE